MKYENENRCPRCHRWPMVGWEDLSEEERMVVERLPASAEYEKTERIRRHLWCRNCWYERVETASADA